MLWLLQLGLRALNVDGVEIDGCEWGVMLSCVLSRELHSTDSSSASMGSVMAGPDVDGVVEVLTDRVEGC